MIKNFKYFTFASSMLMATSIYVYAVDLTKSYDMPEASKIVADDQIPDATKFTMQKSCTLDDVNAIARGKYMYHNLNSKAAKGPIPKGLNLPKNGEVKQYGNCVACHNTEDAIGGGTVGPDLTGYKEMFIDTKARDAQFVYQKIADPRVDNEQTSMTINLTTKLFNESELCDLTAYVLSVKQENITPKNKK